MHGARIDMRSRALVAAAALEVPVAVRIGSAQRRIACPAILHRGAAENSRTQHRGRGNQRNNQASHANLTILPFASRVGEDNKRSVWKRVATITIGEPAWRASSARATS